MASIAEQSQFYLEEWEWDTDTYHLIREAFQLVGFKRSSECSTADLVDAYHLDDDYKNAEQPEWILDFRAWQNMVATLPVRLEDVLRARNMRFRTRQHFINLDKVEYDYDELKQSRLALHSEYASMFRIFRRLVAIRYATPVAIAVPVHQQNAWVKTNA